MGYFKFYHGTMASGKTTMLLQTHYNLTLSFPGKVMLINKFDRSGDNVCTSRLGNSLEAKSVHNGESIVGMVSEHELARSEKLKYLLVDEVQFFLPRQIAEMAYLTDYKDINVIAYGLLTNYKGKLFKGSQRAIELADEVIQISNEMRCWCGAKATHNSVTSPITDKNIIESELDRHFMLEYEVVCRKHMYEKIKSNVDLTDI